MKIHHIGYAVKNMEKAIAAFGKLGYLPENGNRGGVTYDPIRQIDICFMGRDGYRIELVSPASKGEGGDAVSDIIRKVGNSPYHICYETDDLDGTLEKLSHDGFTMFLPPAEAPALEGRRVAFCMNRSIGIVEFLEE